MHEIPSCISYTLNLFVCFSFSFQVFFVGVLLIIASLVYLGSFKDYSSLTRNAKTTPKEELPIPDKGNARFIQSLYMLHAKLIRKSN